MYWSTLVFTRIFLTKVFILVLKLPEKKKQNRFPLSSDSFSCSHLLSGCMLIEVLYLHLITLCHCLVSTSVLYVSLLPEHMEHNHKQNTAYAVRREMWSYILLSIPLKLGFLAKYLFARPDFNLFFVSNGSFSSVKNCFPAESHPPSVGFEFVKKYAARNCTSFFNVFKTRRISWGRATCRHLVSAEKLNVSNIQDCLQKQGN